MENTGKSGKVLKKKCVRWPSPHPAEFTRLSIRKLICSGIEMHKEKSSYYQNKTYGEGVNAASYLRGIDDWGT